jgi:CRAL/TRIO domain
MDGQPTSIQAAIDLGAFLIQEIPIDDPVTMLLTSEEMERAHTIKAAVERDQTLTNLTDFEYVQWALTHGNETEGNDLSTVLAYLARMQTFREFHGIQDTVEEGTACVEALIRQQPGMILTHHYDPIVGNCVTFDDWRAFLPSRIKTTQDHACFLKGSYYRYHGMYPSFLATRLGMTTTVECEGVTWENFDARFHQEFLDELFVCYPHRYFEMYMVNSPTVVNVAYGLWKKDMSTNLKKTFRLGSQLSTMTGNRLDTLFLTPTPESANQETVATAKTLLTARYQNQATYQLPPPLP